MSGFSAANYNWLLRPKWIEGEDFMEAPHCCAMPSTACSGWRVDTADKARRDDNKNYGDLNSSGRRGKLILQVLPARWLKAPRPDGEHCIKMGELLQAGLAARWLRSEMPSNQCVQWYLRLMDENNQQDDYTAQATHVRFLQINEFKEQAKSFLGMRKELFTQDISRLNDMLQPTLKWGTKSRHDRLRQLNWNKRDHGARPSWLLHLNCPHLIHNEQMNMSLQNMTNKKWEDSRTQTLGSCCHKESKLNYKMDSFDGN